MQRHFAPKNPPRAEIGGFPLVRRCSRTARRRRAPPRLRRRIVRGVDPLRLGRRPRRGLRRKLGRRIDEPLLLRTRPARREALGGFEIGREGHVARGRDAREKVEEAAEGFHRRSGTSGLRARAEAGARHRAAGAAMTAHGQERTEGGNRTDAPPRAGDGAQGEFLDGPSPRTPRGVSRGARRRVWLGQGSRRPPQTQRSPHGGGGAQSRQPRSSFTGQSATTRSSSRSFFSAAWRNWRTRSIETPSSPAISSRVASSK